MNQMKIGSVVLEMTVHAVLALRILHLQSEVVAMFFRERFGDFFMAFEALEGGRFGSKFVTTRALRCTRKTLVGIGERTRRNLRVGRRAQYQNC